MKLQYVLLLFAITINSYSLIQSSQNNPLFVYEVMDEYTIDNKNNSDSLSLSNDTLIFDSQYSHLKSKFQPLFDNTCSEEVLTIMCSDSLEIISSNDHNVIDLKNNFLESITHQMLSFHQSNSHEKYIELLRQKQNSQTLKQLLSCMMNKSIIDISDKYIINQTYRKIIEIYEKTTDFIYEEMSNALVPNQYGPKIPEETIILEQENCYKNIKEQFMEMIENKLSNFSTLIENHMREKNGDNRKAYLSELRKREEWDCFFNREED